jgi:lipopolysaccharide/colanic/teichoic acid biosynthesis glycosyltransferase
MTAERTDAGTPADVRLDRRVGSWTTGFHGVVAHSDLPELAGVSFRDVALGRRSLGSGRLEALTDLPSNDRPRFEPTRDHGGRHVGRNGTEVSIAHAPDADVASTVTAGDVLVAERPGGLAIAATTRPDVGPIEPNLESSSVAGAAVRDEVATSVADEVLDDGLAADGASDDEGFVDDGDTERYIEHRLEDAAWVFLPNRSRTYAVAKRALDLVGACLLLLVALPVMAVLAIIIKIDSPGPALFRQDRVTLGGRHFRFFKFRTMYVDARERFPDLYAYQFTDSNFDDAFYKLADDPRNTRFGSWLRRTTLDELPNLFNVVLGDLSLVGPRPELPELVRYYRPEELACFFTKAGLTGLAQVAGRSLLTVRERLTLDLRYVSHQTLLLDLRILWRTVIVVVARKGAF